MVARAADGSLQGAAGRGLEVAASEPGGHRGPERARQGPRLHATAGAALGAKAERPVLGTVLLKK